MKLLFEHFDDLIAVIIVVGVLLLIGINCEVDLSPILTMAAGYAFGKTTKGIKEKAKFE